ncbi:MAG TPA: hypothetical protein EYG00_09125, partial [Alcanivorax sp.]|nr:hypothetical protein [Alcanivorax sp.]
MNNASGYAAPRWGVHPNSGLLLTAVFLIVLGAAPTALAQTDPGRYNNVPLNQADGQIQLALLEQDERTPRRPRPEPRREPA